MYPQSWSIQLLGTESSHQVSLLISSYFTVNGQNYCQIPSVILNPVLYGVLLEFYFIRVLCTDFDIHDEIHCWSPRDIISCSGLTCYIWHHRHRHQLFYTELWLEEIPLPHTDTDWPKHWQLLSWWVWESPLSLQDHHSPYHLALVDRGTQANVPVVRGRAALLIYIRHALQFGMAGF